MNTYDNVIKNIQSQGLSRMLKNVEQYSNGYSKFKGKRMLNLSSNDYLGLSTDIALKEEFMTFMSENPKSLSFGSGSSRLLSGNSRVYSETEEVLKCWYKSEAALFFNSGYHANLGVLPALSGKKDLILSDKLCHASIIDGIRLCVSDHVRYKHFDYEHLEFILRKKRHLYQHVFIVTESVFSMDGDKADLNRLVQIRENYDAILYVDEAHAVGSMGSTGLGLSEVQGVTKCIDIIIGTMGKAMASIGAYVIIKDALKQVLVNKARTLIFSTALPRINMEWSKFIISKMPQLSNYRNALKQLVIGCNQHAKEMEFQPSNGYIIPIIVGENKIAIELAEFMQSKGFLIFPIRPPTVPIGTARLRISLTANLHQKKLNEAMEVMRDFLVS